MTQHPQCFSSLFCHRAEKLVAQHLQRFLCSQGLVSENLEPLISTSNQTTIIAEDEFQRLRLCQYVSATMPVAKKGGTSLIQ